MKLKCPYCEEIYDPFISLKQHIKEQHEDEYGYARNTNR